MGFFNFQERFAWRVRLGLLQPAHPKAKRQTVRSPRRDGRDPEPVERVALYTGMRTPWCLKLGETVVQERRPIVIHTGLIGVDGELLRGAELKQFALADGFDTTAELFRFFEKRGPGPFHGYLYRW